MNPDSKESIWRMNDKEFNNSYEEKLNKLKNIYLSLDSNKCNILSTEHYLLPKVFSYRECTFDVFKWLLRLISLFNKTNIDLNFFLVIRNHSDIIPSFYFQTSINRFLKEFSISGKVLIASPTLAAWIQIKNPSPLRVFILDSFSLYLTESSFFLNFLKYK